MTVNRVVHKALSYFMLICLMDRKTNVNWTKKKSFEHEKLIR